MRPPASVYLAAFVSGFEITAASRSGLTSISTRRRGQVDRQHVALALDRRTRRLDRGLITGPSVMLAPQLELALGDARDVQQVVEQPGHVALALGSPVATVQRGVVELRRGGDLRRVADRRQRIAQLVRQRREEFVLAAVGDAQRSASIAFCA